MKKKYGMISLLLGMVLCISSTSTTVFAQAPSSVDQQNSQVIPSRTQSWNGMTAGTVRFNGYDYSYTLWIDIDTAAGTYRSGCTTLAAVTRLHYGVNGKWLTKNYGYQTATGNPVTINPQTSASTATTYSAAVACPKGAAQVVEYTLASANVKMYGDTSVTGGVSRWAT